MSTTTVVDVDGARWIRFNRPEKRNALTLDDVATIRGAIVDLPRDVRCIVFAGSGGHFSAGADVAAFQGESGAGRLEVAASSVGQQMLTELRTCQVPTIAAIEGYCVGIAMDITAVCDLRVASTTALFSMPEVKIGLPVVGDAALFERYMGLTRAKEMLLTGRFYPARDMWHWGYLNQLTEPDCAETEASTYVEEFRALPPRTLAAQKRIFEAWLQLPHRDAARMSILEYAVTVAHPETSEWIATYKTSSAQRRASAAMSPEAGPS
ncbi:enoyl-CoA hydratase/isomerase family protein [Nocardioides sp. AN3]